MKHILIGNPNVGKTTFLNSLTGSNEHVGNWHGVTVDYLEKKYNLENAENIIVDLPGLYSLNCFSYEEEVARDYIISSSCDVINLIDANNLARNLYLTLELLELNKNVQVCINFANELKKTNTQINIKKLSQMLGSNVILFNAQNKIETKNIIKGKFKNNFIIPYLQDLPINKVKDIIGESIKNVNLNSNYVYLKVLEQDEFIIKQLKLTEFQINELKK